MIRYCFLILLVTSQTDGQRGNSLNFTQHFSNFSADGDLTSLIQPQAKRCFKKSVCIPLNHTTCLGTKLPYRYTSLLLANDSFTQDEVQEKLGLWKALQNVPRCWAVVQPLLCAVYMPKCEDAAVMLPSQELCRKTRGPCRIVEKEHGWPEFLDCDKTENFPRQCKNDILGLKFNTTGRCERPLVQTDNALSWYEGVEGCGIQCENPLFTSDEHHSMHLFIAVVGSICLGCTLFTVLTFIIEWKNANKYPALIIFYINGCFMVASIGWLAQFTPLARKDIVCRTDGTARRGEPSSGENHACVIVFVLVYYFTMAGVIWFVILAYSWHVLFNALGKFGRNLLESKTAYFHIGAWSAPLIMTITILALGEVDGDSISGICFVGYVNPVMRASFLLAPIGAVLICGGFFLCRGLVTLIYLMVGSREIISSRANHKIKVTIIRIGSTAFLAFVFVVTTFVCHVIDYTHHSEWMDSFRDYVICEANVTVARKVTTDIVDVCKIQSRPDLLVSQIHLLSLFGAGVVMSSWVWTKSTYDAWKRFVRRLFQQPVNEPVKLSKHAMIAKAFAKRHQLMHDGRMSVTYHSTHDDPVGMNFDLNSAATSRDLSSAFVRHVPRFMYRRGALISSLRSGASNTDLSHRKLSLESVRRRRSLDSQISLHVNDTHDWMGIPHRSHHHDKKRHKKKPRRMMTSDSRRGSDTSQASAIAMTASNHWLGGLPGANHRRRHGSDGSVVSYKHYHGSGGNLWSIANRRQASIESNLSMLSRRRSSAGSILYPAMNRCGGDGSCCNLMLTVQNGNRGAPIVASSDKLPSRQSSRQLSRNQSTRHSHRSSGPSDDAKRVKYQKQLPVSSCDSSGFVTGETQATLPGQVEDETDGTPVFFVNDGSSRRSRDGEVFFVKPVRVRRKRPDGKSDVGTPQQLSAANLINEWASKTASQSHDVLIVDVSDEDY
ncbi:SMO (predicted) [Pycnogonum litorale]